MEKKDTEFNVGLKTGGIEGNLNIKNYRNRIIESLGNIYVDKLENWRWNNAIKFFDKYDQLRQQRMLDDKETPLPPKYLYEILGHAFLEDEDSLQEMWARLLINWQDPETRFDLRPVYIEMLKSMTATEVAILKIVANDLIILQKSSNHHFNFETENYDFSDIKYFISKKRIITSLNISEDEYKLAMLNLFRNMCMESVKTPFRNMIVSSVKPIICDHNDKFVMPTSLGRTLIKNIYAEKFSEEKVVDL